MIGTSQCADCIHLHRTSELPGIRCDAYPNGIPKALLHGDADHNEPFPGDKGIRYERDPQFDDA